jgi:hypothetical protein
MIYYSLGLRAAPELMGRLRRVRHKVHKVLGLTSIVVLSNVPPTPVVVDCGVAVDVVSGSDLNTLG